MDDQLVLDGIGRSVDPEAEFFPTPAALCTEICATLAANAYLYPPPHPLHAGLWDSIIEPSAGDGAFIAAARHRWPRKRVLAIDIRDTRSECLAAGAEWFFQDDWLNFCQHVPPTTRSLILGNPPRQQSFLQRRPDPGDLSGPSDICR